MTMLAERAAQIATILQDPETQQTKKLLLKGHDLEISITPEWDGSLFLEYIQITVYNNREKSPQKRAKEANQFMISFNKLLGLHKNGELPDYLYNLAMQQIIEKPSDTATKFMEVLNRKQA